MSTIETRVTGPYTAGEKPPAILVDFFASSPTNLSGWSLALTCERDGTELTSWGSIAWSDATIARATVTMPVLALASGKTRQQFVIQAWAGNGSYRIATLPICFFVHQQIGTTPSI